MGVLVDTAFIAWKCPEFASAIGVAARGDGAQPAVPVAMDGIEGTSTLLLYQYG